MAARATRSAVLPLVVGALSLPLRLALAQSDQGTSVAVDPEIPPPPTLEPQTDPGEDPGQDGGRSVTPMVAPVPFKNTQIGRGLMLMGGLIHRFDADTTVKPSTAWRAAPDRERELGRHGGRECEAGRRPRASGGCAQMTRKYPMHMRFDYSWGRDDDLFYFGVGEAF
jgi:hypothetical protein